LFDIYLHGIQLSWYCSEIQGAA